MQKQNLIPNPFPKIFPDFASLLSEKLFFILNRMINNINSYIYIIKGCEKKRKTSYISALLSEINFQN